MFFLFRDAAARQEIQSPPKLRITLPLLMIGIGLLISCHTGNSSTQTITQEPQAQRQGISPLTSEAQIQHGVLRVCADPNNLPFSNRQEKGFENEIAQLLAHELKAKVEYTWWAQRRGFVRNTLKVGLCDLIVGLPSSSELAFTTAPYYRSSYTFVWRKDRHLRIHSFDDQLLRTLKIGVQLIGDDFANTPPAHALTNRNIIQNVKGYSVYGDYSHANPPARIIEAVVNREIDVAVVWGPLAGYFANRQHIPLEVVPVSPRIDLPYLPFVYDISMGVRREDVAFKERLDSILNQRSAEIEAILKRYNVPRE